MITMKNCMKIEFIYDGDLSLNRTLKNHNMTIIVGDVFLEDNSYYTQVFLNECLYKLWIT